MEFRVQTQLSLQDLTGVIEGTTNNPAEFLGPHHVELNGRKAISVRAYLPHSQQVWLLDEAAGVQRPMRRIHPAGIFEGLLPVQSESHKLKGPLNERNSETPAYRFRVANQNGNISDMHDPHAVPSFLSDFDRYLFGAGRHWKLYDKLGAHLREVDGQGGVNFSVWAPNAHSVQVVGDFNHWDGRGHTMQKHIPAGIWELFVPNVEAGSKYKFRIRTFDGQTIDKTDPMGFYAELPPRTASIVQPLDRYTWNDGGWMQRRAEQDQLAKPISVYEVHLASWRKSSSGVHGWMNYRELAHQLVTYCKEMGFTDRKSVV